MDKSPDLGQRPGAEEGVVEWLSWGRYRRRIYLLVLLAALAVIASVLAFALWPLQQAVTRQAHDAALASIERSARLFDAESRMLLGRAEEISRAVHAKIDFTPGVLPPAMRAEQLRALLDSEPQLVGVAVLSADGDRVAGFGHEIGSADAGSPDAEVRPVRLPLNDAGLAFTLPLRDPAGRPGLWLRMLFDASSLRSLLTPDEAGRLASFMVWQGRIYFSTATAKARVQSCGDLAALMSTGCGGRMEVLEYPLSGGDWRLVAVRDAAVARQAVATSVRWLLPALVLVAVGLGFATAVVVRPLNRMFRRTADLYELSARDELTGLSNRRHLIESLDKELARAGRHGLTLNVLLLDIDRFKRINDTYGHGVGDRAIQQVGGIVQHLCRGEDVTARLGGDEFVVVQTGVSLEGAMRFAQRLRQAVAQLHVDVREDRLRLSTSVGLAHVPAGMASHMSRDRVIGMADRALYRAKAAGRNQVKVRSLRVKPQPKSASS